jgi:aminopeptidase
MINENTKKKFNEATKNILEKNLKILEKPFFENKIVLVYDEDSKLSKILWEAYKNSLEKYSELKIEIIIFLENEKEILKEKLMTLEIDSTVILVQSTNFRLDNFRLRLNLKNAWIWCIEHNHLWYIRDSEIENYADSIEYRTPFYIDLSNRLKENFDNADKLEIFSKNWDKLLIEWGFEDMKQNTWDYWERIRAGSFPIWENFTESSDFSKVNWKLSIRAFPNMQFEVIQPEVFTVEIKESIIVWYSDNTPEWFIELVEKIKLSEDWECFVRELGFWLNPWITWDRTLNDVNACERIMWFHMSMWKKHQIYRKKFHRKIMQRYHIDIFSDVDYILLDWKRILEDEKFIV